MCVKRVCACVCVVAAMLFVNGCIVGPSEPDTDAIGPRLYIAQSDYQSGLLEWAPTLDHGVSANNLPIYSDAFLRVFAGHLYIIERAGADNIMKIDPARSGLAAVLYQTHLGNDWNPQDMVFASATRAYVANNNEPNITVFNPTTGTVVSHIDIAPYTFMPDSNTSPNAAALQLAQGYLYALLQRRHGWNPGAPSLLLKIDIATNAVVDTIALRFMNGKALAYTDGFLYVTNPGNSFSVGDGAIEKVDLATSAVSTVVDGATLNGDPHDLAHKEGSRFYVTLYYDWKDMKVAEMDMVDGTIVEMLPGVKDAFGGIFYDGPGGTLYVAERDSIEMGVRVYRNNRQVGPIVKSGNSLPPVSVAVLR